MKIDDCKMCNLGKFEAECDQSPNGHHEEGMVKWVCFGPDQGKTVWCKWCNYKLPDTWMDHKLYEKLIKGKENAKD